MRIIRKSTRVLGGAFILSLTLSAQTFTTLYNFGSQDHDGIKPGSRAILGQQGELYGTTDGGGEFGFGTVYELLPPTSPGGAWTEQVLHSFNDQNGDGEHPSAGLLMGPNGALYGVTMEGALEGSVFELDPPTSTHWPFTVLYQFTKANSGKPRGALAFGVGGSLYGALGNSPEFGAVYSLTPPPAAGGAWTRTTLYSFPGGSGGNTPLGTLAVSTNGTIFGVTEVGGVIKTGCAEGCGTVFSLAPPAVSGGPWSERLLYGFGTHANDGSLPQAGLVIGPTGVLYGTTEYAGGPPTLGTVFSLSPPALPDEPMVETVLHAFTGPDGANPASTLVLAPNGARYGTTEYGGANGLGVVFELAPPASPGGSWTETVLHSFAGLADGESPNGLALGPDGTLYGTTNLGGASNYGTVFSLTP